MTWSLFLHHGDLALSSRQLATATDETKLVQDLRCAILEQMGTDPMHPEFGSLIDGGITPDGSSVPSLIGGSNVKQIALTIQSEIERIARNYQSQQLARAKDDRTVYNRVSLSPGEVLLAISNLTISQQEDTLQVEIKLQTARGQDLSIVFPILTNN